MKKYAMRTISPFSAQSLACYAISIQQVIRTDSRPLGGCVSSTTRDKGRIFWTGKEKTFSSVWPPIPIGRVEAIGARPGKSSGNRCNTKRHRDLHRRDQIKPPSSRRLGSKKALATAGARGYGERSVPDGAVAYAAIKSGRILVNFNARMKAQLCEFSILGDIF